MAEVPKIKVEIIYPDNKIRKGKFPIDGTGKKVLIKKGGFGRGDRSFEPTFDNDCILWEGFWNWRKPKLMVIANAEKCINFKTGEVPPFSFKTLKEYTERKVLEKAGAVPKQSPILIIILALIVIQIFILMRGFGYVSF